MLRQRKDIAAIICQLDIHGSFLIGASVHLLQLDGAAASNLTIHTSPEVDLWLLDISVVVGVAGG